MSALARKPENIRNIIKDYSVDYGVFELCFYKDRKPVYVYIDDRFILDSSGCPLYAHSRKKKISWVSVIEKGYAKFLGSYEELNFSTCLKSFVDFTGGVVARVNLRDDPKDSTKDFKKVYSLLEESWYMCACTRTKVDEKILSKIHTYTVLGIYKTPNNGPTLVKLRDPLPPRKRGDEPLCLNPADLERIGSTTRKEIGYDAAKKSNMQFFMRFEYFCKNFETVMACCYIPSNFKCVSIHGAWTEGSMGGSIKSAAWGENPQYVVTVTEDTKVFIVVSQKKRGLMKIGLWAYSLEGREASRIVSPHNGSEDGWGKPIHKEDYTDAQEVGFSIDVKKGKLPLVVIPALEKDSQPGEFSMNVYAKESSHPAIEAVKEWKFCKVVEEKSWACKREYIIRTHSPFCSQEQNLHFVVRAVGTRKNDEGIYPRVEGNGYVMKGDEGHPVIACKLTANSEYTVSLKSKEPKYSGKYKIIVCSNECEFDLS